MKVLMISKAMVVAAYHGKLRELAKLGVDLTLIVPPNWGRQRLETRDSQEYQIRVSQCLLSGKNHFHFYLDPVRKIDADLVHIDEEPWSLVTYQFVRLANKWRKPAVFFSWQNIHKNYPPPFNAIERYTFRNVKGAIAGNQEVCDILRMKGFEKAITIIPQLGVDPVLFAKCDTVELRRKLGLERAFVIGYMGRIVAEKGIADLIRAVSALPPQHVLVMVGDGPFREQSERLAAQLGIADRMRTIPQISSLEVPAYMSLFDVLVLPSRTTTKWKEQFGRVLIEAMACGTPVVGSDSGEIPKVVGKAGLVFPEGNVAVLADHLLHLSRDPRFAGQLGGLGRDRVLQHFTHGRIAEQTFHLYREVLSGSHPLG